MAEQNVNTNSGRGNLEQSKAFLVENTNVMDHKCLGQTRDEIADISPRVRPGSLRDLELAATELHGVDADYLDFILELRADPELARLAHKEKDRIEGVDHA